MAVTQIFTDLVVMRVAAEPAFGASLLREGIDIMLAGDVDAGKSIARDTSTRPAASTSDHHLPHSS